MTARLFADERCFWHHGGNYAGMAKVEGLVQPGAGLPESPESKRRLLNLLHVTGLARELDIGSAPEATRDELLRVHPAAYLDAFRAVSDAGGGELGLRAPFGAGGYDVAALSAGLAIAALRSACDGVPAYALSRPPGHHCLPDTPMGFCLLANIAIAVEAMRAEGRAARVAVLDWDVHHGNGTEAIFLDRADVLTVSIHQERNFPLDTGAFEERGRGAGRGANLNLPLPPGTGHAGMLMALDRLAIPAIRAHRPDLIVIACGYDAAFNDPLGRFLATVETFRGMTRRVMTLAGEVAGRRLALVHEGGYNEVYVPFCGHAVIQTLAGSGIDAGDPFGAAAAARQPGPDMDALIAARIEGWGKAL